MKNIFLHVGRGKTGSTAIQAFMAKQSERLSHDGIHYIQSDGGDRGSGHQQFAKSFILSPPEYMIPAINPKEVREKIASEICESASQSIVISSENFPLADANAVIEFLHDLPVKVTVKVILFARTQDELLESEYNQMVKLKRVTKSAQEYFAQDFSGADFFEEATKWESLVGQTNTICRIYDGKNGGVIEQFLNCLPGPLRQTKGQATVVAASQENRSLGMLALTTVRLLNNIEIEDRTALYRHLVDQFNGGDLPAVLFNSDSARTIRDSYADSNTKFLQRYFNLRGSDLGGRKYSDEERNALRDRIIAMDLSG